MCAWVVVFNLRTVGADRSAHFGPVDDVRCAARVPARAGQHAKASFLLLRLLCISAIDKLSKQCRVEACALGGWGGALQCLKRFIELGFARRAAHDHQAPRRACDHSEHHAEGARSNWGAVTSRIIQPKGRGHRHTSERIDQQARELRVAVRHERAAARQRGDHLHEHERHMHYTRSRTRRRGSALTALEVRGLPTGTD